MGPRTSRWILSAAALAALSFPATLPAADGEFAPDRSPQPSHEAGRLAEALELSAEQREQIRVIHDQQRERMETLRHQVQEGRRELREMKTGEGVDEERLRAAARSQADARVDLMLAREEVRDQVRALLTPEQRQRAEQLRQDRRLNHRRYGGGERGHRVR